MLLLVNSKWIIGEGAGKCVVPVDPVDLLEQVVPVDPVVPVEPS